MKALLSIAAALLAASAALAVEPAASPDRAWLLAQPLGSALGGSTGRAVTGDMAFTFPAPNLDGAEVRKFSLGNRVFNTNWVVAPASVDGFDGLGPVFNRVSCSGCHLRDGRGQPPARTGDPLTSMLVRISVPGVSAHGGPKPHPAYGDQLGEAAIPGVKPEARTVIHWEETSGAFPDGEAYALRRPRLEFRAPAHGPLSRDLLTSLRVAPAMIGLGLLEAVPEAELAALADPDDRDGDGISGRQNLVWDAEAGRAVTGRFGWKANQPGLRQQNADAAFGDIGLTSALHPQENCPPAQGACARAKRGGEPDLSEHFLDALTFYTRTIAVPHRRGEGATQGGTTHGEALFRSAGCAGCHMPTLTTGEAGVAAVANQTFHPFTDLLLHDMGEGLADGRPDFAADGREWRTPPLWGLGLVEAVNGHTTLLHDGRARDIQEAILWHGGEAEAARNRFMALGRAERAALIAFLKSL